MANIDSVKLPDNSEYNIQVKVVGATNGNVAVMDSSGNVADGGRPLSDLDTWSKYGAKNLIRNIMSTTTVNGVKFTVNADGSVTTSQSATDNIYRPYADFNLPAGDYILTGSPSGSSSNTHYSYVRNEDTTEQYYDYDGSGASFSLAVDSHIKVYIAYKSGQTANETFYPMIRDASVVDATFKPIAETNRELTVGKADTSTLAPTEDGTTASRAYAVGEHFMRGGKYCVCIAAISSGGTFTLNTNYKETTIGTALRVRTKTVNNTSDANGNVNLGLAGNIPLAFVPDGTTNYPVVVVTNNNGDIILKFINTDWGNTWSGASSLNIKGILYYVAISDVYI